MSKALINDEYLKAIDDATRSKNNTITKYKPNEIELVIKSITTGKRY